MKGDERSDEEEEESLEEDEAQNHNYTHNGLSNGHWPKPGAWTARTYEDVDSTLCPYWAQKTFINWLKTFRGIYFLDVFWKSFKLRKGLKKLPFGVDLHHVDLYVIGCYVMVKF